MHRPFNGAANLTKVGWASKAAQAVKVWDIAGNVNSLGMGTIDMAKNGVNFSNSVDMLSGLFGLSGNIIGMRKSVPCFGACFVAGTQVLTDKGLKNIEDIKVGDFVLSKDEVTKKSDYKPVVNLFVTHPVKLYTITYKDAVGDAYEIKVSGEHPFWVADKGWIAARLLTIDDRLVITDDKTVVITDITNEVAPEGKAFTTYNFEVADTHTYFVLQEGKLDGCFAVWVHNTGACKITYNKKDQVTRLRATVDYSDLGKGTSTTKAARDSIKKAGKLYEAGHIRGKLLGGLGGKLSDNVFAQLRKINRGKYNKFEKYIADHLKKQGKLGKVDIDVKLLNRNKLGVPQKIIYNVKGKGLNETRKFNNY